MIDPLTKLFLMGILGGQSQYQASKSILIALYCNMYNIHHAGVQQTNDPTDVPSNSDDVEDSTNELKIPSSEPQRNLPFNLFAPSENVEAPPINPNKAANEILENYIRYKVQ